MTRMKFCGIRRKEDLEWLNIIRPEYAGFIAVTGTKRHVMLETAKELREGMDGGISTVGVFRNAPMTEIRTWLSEGVISVVQLHGDESEEYIRELKEQTGATVIKAFHISSAEDMVKAESTCADYPLLDNGNGGTGEAFDWSLAGLCRRDYFLAGGLRPGNAGEAVEKLHPYALDVSSGIETDGSKDPEKMRAFADAVRRADAKKGTT